MFRGESATGPRPSSCSATLRGNWVPALSLGLAATPYRLAVFGFSSCGLANIAYTSSWSTLTNGASSGTLNLPGVVRALHPVAVIGASGAVGTDIPDKTWINGVKNVFDETTIGSPSAKRDLHGHDSFFVRISRDVSHGPERSPGLLTYLPAGQRLLRFDPRPTRRSRVPPARRSIKTTKYFCYSDTCSPVIGNELVYSDIDHVTIVYSSYISKVVTVRYLRR